MEIDHIFPLSRYNNNHWTNLYPTTKEYNNSKLACEPDEDYLIKTRERAIEFQRINLFR